MTHIDPLALLGNSLLSVENPVRYLGGEYGQIIKQDAHFTVALAFPDMYEIGMSNLAIKILYDGFNRLPEVRCERVFAPAPDFEALLLQKSVPLYTLETGIPLHETDVIAVSIGYEPGITALLTILNSGGVPLSCMDRSDSDPIVIAGGCGITNPAPFSKFIDAVFVGEAEAGLFTLIEDLAIAKKRGASRNDLLQLIQDHPACWTSSKNAERTSQAPCARRAIYSDFGGVTDRQVCFPTPNMRIVQDHGSVEIMRGCPNGCRFCHAGIYYRPQRIKPLDRVIQDVDYLVNRGGYREISLMSLSSGDYPHIDSLIDQLTARYSNRHVSFQLPSLKVNSFTLPLLERMASVRKSGLTFAVETPVDAWQMSLNKEVYLSRIVQILTEAKRHGWSSAKFYFMIGLPVVSEYLQEANEITSFLLEVQERTRVQCTANIGTFIPKPHTPYQWARQISMDEASAMIARIQGSLPRGRFKIRSHLPFTSFIESMMSRGDERVGDIILEAWKRGCRLDAWDDWARPDIWQAVIAEAPWDVKKETLRERHLDEPLPWDGISLGPTKAFFRKEKEKSDAHQLTGRCLPKCESPCGVCSNQISVSDDALAMDPVQEVAQSLPPPVVEEKRQEALFRVVVSFTKQGGIAYAPHLALMEIWNKALMRSGLPVIFTEGFNPLPRFEIAQSMSLGIFSEEEIASFLLYESRDVPHLESVLRDSLPEACKVTRVFTHALSKNVKRSALSSLLWGAQYTWKFYNDLDATRFYEDARFKAYISERSSLCIEPDLADGSWFVRVSFQDDRPLRDLVAEIADTPLWSLCRITKTKTLARNQLGDSIGYSDFFTAFEQIALEHTSR